MFAVELSGPEVNTPFATASVEILSDETVVAWTQATFEVDEPAAHVIFSARRTGGLVRDASLTFTNLGGSAMLDDYAPVFLRDLVKGGTITFAAGQETSVVDWIESPVDDAFDEGPESFRLRIETASATIGEPRETDITIVDNDSTPFNQDTLLFSGTIDPVDLIISRQANDLRIALYGTSDQVLISNWYGGAANQIETVKAGNGQQLVNSQVEQLIQAMAAFSQQTGLSWEDAIAQRPQDVQAVLAASWQ